MGAPRQRVLVLISVVLVTAMTMTAAAAAPVVTTSSSSQARHGETRTLTNLAHLDFLTEMVTPPAQAGHTTYRLAEEPACAAGFVDRFAGICQGCAPLARFLTKALDQEF